MAEWSDLLQDGMLVDCSTISLSYPPRGLATVSFMVYTETADDLPYSPTGPGFELCIGGVTFKGWITQMSLSPNSEIELQEWRITATAIGCKKEPCNAGCQ